MANVKKYAVLSNTTSVWIFNFYADLISVVSPNWVAIAGIEVSAKLLAESATNKTKIILFILPPLINSSNRNVTSVLDTR